MSILTLNTRASSFGIRCRQYFLLGCLFIRERLTGFEPPFSPARSLPAFGYPAWMEDDILPIWKMPSGIRVPLISSPSRVSILRFLAHYSAPSRAALYRTAGFHCWRPSWGLHFTPCWLRRGFGRASRHHGESQPVGHPDRPASGRLNALVFTGR